MAGLSRRLNGLLSGILPEKRLFIQSSDATRYLRLTPLSQLGFAAAGLTVVSWMAVATATVVIDRVAVLGDDAPAVEMKEAFGTRLEELASERDRREAEARSAQNRFQLAMEQVSRQQTLILESVEERRELSTALDLMRARLDEVASQRDAATDAHDKLVAEMDAVNASMTQGVSGTDLSQTLTTVSTALADAAAARDAAARERLDLEQKLNELELRSMMTAKRQEEMVGQLEQAVAASFGPLESMFDKTDVKVDQLIETVRSSYSGQGGPMGATTVSTRSFNDPAVSNRFDALMSDLDRLNLARIAVEKMPFGPPVTATVRLTSGFGGRNDPFGRGRRGHAGIDLAAPRGTPVLATGDGVIVTAGRESGYGNVVRVRHELGFETVYAHLDRIRVKVGQEVSRGVQVGDMGSTGRSTGSHLHYEVRVNGTPMNPMTYLEAAKDVF